MSNSKKEEADDIKGVLITVYWRITNKALLVAPVVLLQ